jgi:hypothetical protein
MRRKFSGNLSTIRAWPFADAVNPRMTGKDLLNQCAAGTSAGIPSAAKASSQGKLTAFGPRFLADS